jgi:hypothetical protein
MRLQLSWRHCVKTYQCSGLVEDNRVHFAGHFQRRSSFHQHSMLRSNTSTNHNGGRRGQAQSTRTRYDQTGDGKHQTKGHSVFTQFIEIPIRRYYIRSAQRIPERERDKEGSQWDKPIPNTMNSSGFTYQTMKVPKDMAQTVGTNTADT